MKKHILLLSIFVALLALVFVIFMRFGEPRTASNIVSLPTGSRTEVPIIPGQSNQIAPPTTDATNMRTVIPKLARDLVAGGRQWELLFADQSLPPETQQRIKYDLNLVFGHMTTFEIDVLDGPSIASVGEQFDRRVRFEGGSLRRPLALKNDTFGCLLRGGSDAELYIPKPVTDAYLKAIKLEEQNKATLNQLDQFLERMSQIKEHPIENVRDLFVLADDFKSAEADLAAIPAADFAEGWGGKVYRSPSILDVSSTAGSPFEKYGSLLATTYAISVGKFDEPPPLIYHHGQWRFLLQRPPT